MPPYQPWRGAPAGRIRPVARTDRAIVAAPSGGPANQLAANSESDLRALQRTGVSAACTVAGKRAYFFFPGFFFTARFAVDDGRRAAPGLRDMGPPLVIAPLVAER